MPNDRVGLLTLLRVCGHLIRNVVLVNIADVSDGLGADFLCCDKLYVIEPNVRI